MKASRYSKKPSLPQNDRADMGVTQAELSKNILEPYRVVLKLSVPGVWSMELHTASGKVLDVQTRRGPAKIWRALDDALGFVGEYCAGAESITAYGEFGGQKLMLEITKT